MRTYIRPDYDSANQLYSHSRNKSYLEKEIIDIKRDMMDADDIIESLKNFNISVTDSQGEFRNLIYILKDVQQKWKHTSSISASARLGDLAQSIIRALVAEKALNQLNAKDVGFEAIYQSQTQEDSLDKFLEAFKVY